ncbi:glycosyltransferase [Ornithinimicrobium cerasi]|uniref:glycosyltransferase n=1 Tax=Ornithinimicrobium cerasi TaxID=2248773 RepID=UPI000F00EEAC|nr:glycosyltransferase [Ornithinimicrobium cerasi]
MRVLVVTTWYPTAASPGTGIFVARDVAAIATLHDVRVLHLVAPTLVEQGPSGYAVTPGGRGGAPAASAGAVVPVEQLVMDPRRPDHVLRAALRVGALAGHADVVHTMAVSALLPMTGWRPAVPWVHTEHWSGLTAPETLSPALRLARGAVRPLLRRPDVVAVVGEGLAEGVRGLRAGPVVVVPNIVDGPDVPAPRRAPAVALTDRGPLELVAVGALIDRKDPLTAVEATAELRRRGVDARLTWVGEGPLRGRTAERAGRLAVPLTLTGAVDPPDVPGLVSASDLFLLPTRAETFCVAAAEALARGRPVVVGDSGGPRAFVAPPSGLLVPPGAPAAQWADAVEQVWGAAAGLSAEDVAAPVLAAYGAAQHAARVDALYAGLTPRDTGSPDEPVGPVDHHASQADLGSGGEPVGPVDHRASRADPGSGGEPVSRGPGDRPPDVDVVIATHSSRRRTEQAVRSVLDGVGAVAARVTVVCHDLPLADVAAGLSEATRADGRVRLLEHHDGLGSPAGPFTAGLEAATAPWVSILGSDDRLSPGALGHWMDVAHRTGAEVVLAQVQLDGAPVPTPPTRLRPLPGMLRRHRDLDLVRDRLSYRSAPLGLLSRAAVERTGARLLPGAQTGEDVPFVIRLYAGARVALADAAPYVVGTDATDRTTSVPRPVRDQLVAVTHLVEDPWLATRPAGERDAVGTKLLRIHVFGAVLTRSDPGWWTPAERADLARITRELLGACPGAADPLSLADHDLLRAVLDPGTPARKLVDLAHARRRHGTPRTLLPSDWRHVLHREAPLRLMAASLAAQR